MIITKYLLFGLVITFFYSSNPKQFYELDQRKTKVIHVLFLSEFDDKLQIFVNGKLWKSDNFQTDESLGACVNGFDAEFLRDMENTVVIKQDDGKIQYKFKTLASTNENYLYISRNSGRWSFAMQQKPIELE